MNFPSARAACFMAGLVCLAAVGAAYVAQHQLNMPPCPWCILQRMLFMVLALLGLLAAAVPWQTLQRWVCALMVPVAASGVAAALWQHFVAAKSNSCAFTLADKIISFTGLDQHWPDMFEVRATCADAAVDLLGMPFEYWSLALFAALGVWSLTNALRRR
jgi:protein dithiol:quinone oxidoreductase